MIPAIALEQVGKTHDGAIVLAAVDLSIPAGQFVALVGGSGAGKTTLLKTVNALAPPTSGVVRIDGEAVNALDGPALRRRIGYVFQEIGLFPHMTVAENIGVVPALLGWGKDEIAVRVGELLDLVDLSRSLATRRPSALSGGQRQRVGVARALAGRPSILLMDEPFGALDPLTRQALGDDVRRLHETLSLTTVMVTHDVAEALLLADRVVVLEHGAIIADAAPRDLMAGHDDPRVEALMAAPRRQAERVRALLDG
ncbi:ABC transporter ATP-binding protein [Caulobacter flavus]|uniref:ABC transporter ATP-binding protein n=1 Tax=Caulobacter flavus TaxID=1679497 RepID=A0A2N5CMS1_9CAUL|nr:ABC transporter ATP-binding protein [Caulobacter flavus]AYV47054.1 ABC transporter ATP-binding protein [Caulobacter flavus]PLR07429.1 ABC transporter ATP-binding protein [Caulobacter flavus]